MATSRELTRSQIGASDVIYDFCCAPCSKDGKNSEAEYQCVDCPAYFCQKCVVFHNKFLDTHTLLDKTAMHSSKGQTLPKTSLNSSLLISDMCRDHPGKVIEMFCGQHDMVCCTVYIAMEHRLCEGIDYIQTVAKGILKGQEKHQTQTSMEKVKKELLQSKAGRENDLRLVDKQRDDMLNDVQTLKKHIIAKVEELEKTSNKQVLLKHKEIADVINIDITSLEDMLKSLQVKLDNITQFKTADEAQLFVHIKHGNAQASKINDYINRVKSKQASTIVSKLDTSIESCLHSVNSLITIIDPYSVSPLGGYSVRVKPDKHGPNIKGVCVLDSNQIIIADFDNDRLKRLDSTFKVTDWVDIPGKPLRICTTGITELAVSIWESKKVQFISVGKSLAPTRSFSVGHICRGICHSQGELYVCCGGCGLGECPGQVRVYDMSGSKLRVLLTDQNGQKLFTLPNNITVSRDSAQLYIADNKTGIIVIDTHGKTRTVITDPRLLGAHDITVDDRGQLFVCGYLSNNIIQTERQGNILQELLTHTDGICEPLSVTYLPNPPRIMVSQFQYENINIFKLK